MSLHIKGQELILHKVVFELKYRFGFSYLDKCGRVINAIQRNSVEWFNSVETPTPQNASLISMENGCVLNFSPAKLDISIERKPFHDEPMRDADVEYFADQSEFVTSIIVDQLGLQEFSRIGFRGWYLRAAETLNDAEEWIQKLSFLSVSEKFVSAFGPKLEALGIAIVIEGVDRKFRLGFNGVELQQKVDVGQATLNVRPRTLHKGQRKFLLKQEKIRKQLQENPEYAAMIDIDAYQDEPEIVRPADFIISSYENSRSNLKKAMEE